MPSKSAPFHQTKCLGPYVFYDITDGQELRGKNSGALSLYNDHEADAAVEILRFFRKRFKYIYFLYFFGDFFLFHLILVIVY